MLFEAVFLTTNLLIKHQIYIQISVKLLCDNVIVKKKK